MSASATAANAARDAARAKVKQRRDNSRAPAPALAAVDGAVTGAMLVPTASAPSAVNIGMLDFGVAVEGKICVNLPPECSATAVQYTM